MIKQSLPTFENDVKNLQNDIYIISWNVNGIRAFEKNSFIDWLHENKPDIVCLQETKIQENQLPIELKDPQYYYTFWNSAERKGYSGTAIYTREKPIEVEYGLGVQEFDNEGRVIIAEYQEFILLNCYFPNGGQGNNRVEFKLNFYQAFLKKCISLKIKNKPIIFCGDVNTAHKEIDLANPKSNKNKTGFLDIERAWIDKFIENGFIDSFRYFYANELNCYTWWSYMNNAKANNSGWRLDYFFLDNLGINNLLEAFIMPNVKGSDHCPIGILFKLANRTKSVFKEKNLKPGQQSLF